MVFVGLSCLWDNSRNCLSQNKLGRSLVSVSPPIVCESFKACCLSVDRVDLGSVLIGVLILTRGKAGSSVDSVCLLIVGVLRVAVWGGIWAKQQNPVKICKIELLIFSTFDYLTKPR